MAYAVWGTDFRASCMPGKQALYQLSCSPVPFSVVEMYKKQHHARAYSKRKHHKVQLGEMPVHLGGKLPSVKKEGKGYFRERR